MKRNWPLIVVAAGFVLFVLNGVLDSGASPLTEVFHGVLGLASFAMIITGLLTTIFRRNCPMFLRVLSTLVFVIVLAVCFGAYCYAIALRNTALIFGKNDLKQASIEYEKLGYVTNYNHQSQVWHSSNVVSIANVKYQCFLTLRSERFNNEGSLAMTTNGVFIWLDAKHEPKIIGARYRPPFFPPRF